MRVIHLRLVMDPLAIGSAVASPMTSLVTSLASTTEHRGATSSTVVESSTETFESSAETSASSADTSVSSVTVETSAASTTTDYTTETTTAEPTTTDATTTTVETTSSAANPTFTMFASGSNAVAGRSLETYNRDCTVAISDPATEDDNPSARPYSIDSQGWIVNDLGWFLCG
ncbi:hypothetical protein FPCIR_886 [Fusarium pseudocircinatum]|uniref:Uncharacterized protein n=1 Tax=Fusarium pseudocircinatum TaxID=56676 RepID=A0A8H5V0L9_9HYPO|nr:hypothetical protein FPCIR_886 [Fusarium pseudocircinatum]